MVRNVILRCLTTHDNVVKIKLLRQTYVNMNIADSISLYFNFRKGHYFFLEVKQHIFDKAQSTFKWM